MPRSFVRRWARAQEGNGCEWAPGVLDRRSLSLPWLYLTSIIKINRPISYVKYYRRAFLNILSLSTFPRLPNGCRASLLSFSTPEQGGAKRDGKWRRRRRQFDFASSRVPHTKFGEIRRGETLYSDVPYPSDFRDDNPRAGDTFSSTIANQRARDENADPDAPNWIISPWKLRAIKRAL